jgi:hypothetical protein
VGYFFSDAKQLFDKSGREMPPLIIKTGTGCICGEVTMDIDLNSGQIFDGSLQFCTAQSSRRDRPWRLWQERELVSVPCIKETHKVMTYYGI